MIKDDIIRVLAILQNGIESLQNDFLVESFPEFRNHKIGLDVDGNCAVLVYSSVNEKIKNIPCDEYKHLSILVDAECELQDNKGKICHQKYTVIKLLDAGYDLQIYFLEICYNILDRIGETPELNNTLDEIFKLLEIFKKLLLPATKTIQGVWSELFVIERSSDPDYMINSWHVNPRDIYDFNDGTDKIEVKSTKQQERSHIFSLNQLNPNPETGVMVVSLLIQETGIGKNIEDLIVSIEERVGQKEYEHLLEIVHQALGDKFEDSFEVYFDYHYACDNIEFYNAEIIPGILKKHVPKEISEVKFKVNLDLIENVSIIRESKLFSSL